MTKITMLVNKVYKEGQTDGMKLFKKETDKKISYTFAANAKDAKLKFKGKIVIDYNQAIEYIKNVR